MLHDDKDELVFDTGHSFKSVDEAAKWMNESAECEQYVVSAADDCRKRTDMQGYWIDEVYVAGPDDDYYEWDSPYPADA